MNNIDKDNSRKNKKKIDYKKLAEQLTVENEDLQASLLRERADAANIRRRIDQEKSQMAHFFKASVIKELLPVIDNFERFLQSIPEDMSDNNYIKGIQKIIQQLNQSLDKIGVQRIQTVGEHFDPNTMEAVTMEEGNGEDDTVFEELQSGYMLGDELLRPAMVRVKS